MKYYLIDHPGDYQTVMQCTMIEVKDGDLFFNDGPKQLPKTFYTMGTWRTVREISKDAFEETIKEGGLQ